MNGRITALAGRVQELTASELGAMDKAARAALYAGGARLLSVVNDDTVVALALLADGSTEWLGSNKPVNNLFDNSQFVIAQAGYNAFHGSVFFAADRWRYNGGADNPVIYAGGKLTIPAGFVIFQKFEASLNDGVPRTLALGTEDGKVGAVALEAGYLSVGDTHYFAAFDRGDAAYIKSGSGSSAILWVALYEGTYTADTLPPYTPKGYAAELAECLRYYQRLNGFAHVGFGISDDNNNMQLTIPLCFPLRTTPVVSGALRVYNSLIDEPVVSYTLMGVSKNALVLFAAVRQDATLNRGQYLQVWISGGEHFEFSAEL